MSIVAPQRPHVQVGGEDNVAIGFVNMPSGVLLTGTPTVEEVGTADLTITQAGVNTVSVVILGQTFAAGNAVLFHRAGGTAGQVYTIKVTVSTDATPADVLVRFIKLSVVDEAA